MLAAGAYVNAVERLQWLAALAAMPEAREAMLRVAIALAERTNASTGGCHPSVASIARETQIEARSVNRAIRALEACGALTVIRTGGGAQSSTNRYRLLPLTSESPLTHESPLPLTHESRTPDSRVPRPLTRGSDKQGIEQGKNRERCATAERGSRLTLEALPQEWEQWTREHRPDLDPAETFDRFRDFWAAKPGKDGRKTDWLATWRNWCRRETAPVNGRHPRLGPAAPEPAGAAYRIFAFED